jgi:hypothetical protein
MADLKISQLSAATALAGTEVVPVVQGGSTKKATIDQILAPAAGKGVSFAAAGGDTLTMYDEGAWTPNQGAAVSVVGAYSSSGTYTRVGRLVTATAIQSGATSVATSPSGILFSNLPFTVGGGVARYSGTTALQFSNAAGAIAVGGTTNVYSCGALSGGDTIVTTITYEV